MMCSFPGPPRNISGTVGVGLLSLQTRSHVQRYSCGGGGSGDGFSKIWKRSHVQSFACCQRLVLSEKCLSETEKKKH